MLPEMRVHVTVGVGIPSAEHVMLSDVLYSLSSIAAMIGLTADNKHTHTYTRAKTAEPIRCRLGRGLGCSKEAYIRWGAH